MTSRQTKIRPLQKYPTGIPGLDEITGGGFPQGRTTILIGTVGAGKTTLALQMLAHAAQRGDAGVFVAFEEEVDRILANAASFGWNLPALLGRRLSFLNANLEAEAVQAGQVDLSGLLAAVGLLVERSKARCVVFDALDVLLGLAGGPEARRRELFRIQAWLKARDLSCVITVKDERGAGAGVFDREAVSFLADCVISLERAVEGETTSHAMHILKYRGSAHSENRISFWIGPRGVEVEPAHAHTREYRVYRQRVSTGIARLDGMLRGGVTRGATVLLTGAPGTSKTSLCGRFAVTACGRGERVLYVCFDEAPAEVARNLASVGIRFAPHLSSGRLRMMDAVPRARSSDRFYAELRAALDDFKPGCIVIDPVSALKGAGSEEAAVRTVHRIMQQCKLRGITSYLTAVVSKGFADIEQTEGHISTLADTWIHLSYLVRAGERNRTLTIVKARGTGHSNQVRELLLSDTDVTLADVYLEEGEVLLGSLRAQKEREAGQAREHARRHAERLRVEHETAIADLEGRIRLLQNELQAQHRQIALTAEEDRRNENAAAAGRTERARRRGRNEVGPARRRARTSRAATAHQ